MPRTAAALEVLQRREVPGLARLYLAALGDGERLVEFVDTLEPGVPKERKWVLMVSTQAGCPVGCRFCDAGTLPFAGNLSAGEILEQVRRALRDNPGLDAARHPKLKIHFARMGEPSLNFAVLEALERLALELPGPEPGSAAPGLLPSLSTVAPRSPAVAPFFERLLELKDRLYGGGRFQLQFSIHSMDEARRRELVPIRTWSLEEVARFGRRWKAPADRKVTLNFAVGDRAAGLDPGRVQEVFSPEVFLIKITPINPTGQADRHGLTNLWVEPPPPIADSARELRRLGFEVVVSPSLPEELDAATSCGQLWSAALRGRAEGAARNERRERESYLAGGCLEAKAGLWLEALRSRSRREPRLSAAGAGLLVVDMQGLFLDRGSAAYLPPARAILANVRRLVDAFRRAGRPVLFTSHAHEDPAADGGLMTEWWRKVCLAGSSGARVSPLLEPDPALTFRKCRYDAFTHPRLEPELRRLGVRHLALAGVTTHLCVESTARSAFDRGLQPFIAADATAAHDEELHLGALRTLAFGFGPVRRTAELLEELAGAA